MHKRIERDRPALTEYRARVAKIRAAEPDPDK